jgi:hypothetical protein
MDLSCASLRGWSVPIRPLLAAGAFSPEDAATLIAAFEDSLRALKLVDRSDPAVTLVAKRVIALAMGGERDPKLLREAVLQSFRNDPGASGL